MAEETIAELNVKIGANLSQLDALARRTRAYAKDVESTFTLHDRIGTSARNMVARQETMFRSARREVGLLINEMRRVGAPAEQIREVANAFGQYGRALKTGLVDQLTMNRMVDQYKDRISASRAGLQTHTRIQTEATRATVASTTAYNAQMMALGRAEARMQNMAATLKRVGAPASMIGQLDTLFNQFQSRVASSGGSKGALGFANLEFQKGLATINRDLKVLMPTLTSGAGGFGLFSKETERAGAALAQLGFGPLSGIASRITALNALGMSTSFMFAGIAAAGVGLGIVLVKVGVALFDAQLKLDKIQSTLYAVTGSVSAANSAFDYTTGVARSLGASLPVVASEYAKLSAAAKDTSLEGQGVSSIFKALTKASVALSLSQDDTAGAFKAVQQMISKGSVQAEELRGQLGERLPGAFQLAAKAMGVTTRELDKMLKSGSVLSSDFLPKFAKVLEETFGKGAAAASEKLQAQVNRLSTEFFLLEKAILENGATGRIYISVIKGIADAFKYLSDSMTIPGFTKQVEDRIDILKKRLAAEQASNFKSPGLEKKLRDEIARQQAFLDQEYKKNETDINTRAQSEGDTLVAGGINQSLNSQKAALSEIENLYESISKAVHGDLAAQERYNTAVESWLRLLEKAEALDGGKSISTQQRVNMAEAMRRMNPQVALTEGLDEHTQNLRRDAEAAKRAINGVSAELTKQLFIEKELEEFDKKVKDHPFAVGLDPKIISDLRQQRAEAAALAFQWKVYAKEHNDARDIVKKMVTDLEDQAKAMDPVYAKTNRQIFIEEKQSQARLALQGKTTLSTIELNNHLEKVGETAGKTFDVTILKKFGEAYKDMIEQMQDQQGIVPGNRFQTEINKAESQARNKFRDLVRENYGEGAVGSAEYAAQENYAVQTARMTVLLKNLRQEYEFLRSPVEAYNDRVKELNDKLQAGVVSQELYTRGLARARLELYDSDPLVRSLIGAFDQLGESMASAFAEGGVAAFDFKKILHTVIADLAKTLFMLSVMGPLKAALFGNTGAPLTQGIGTGGGLFGGFLKMISGFGSGGGGLNLFDIGGGAMASQSALFAGMGGALPMGFATGGSFKVGGSGSQDSQIISGRFTPGELIQITPPGGRGGGGGGGEPTVQINVSVAAGSGQGEKQDQALAKRIGDEIDRIVETKVISVLRFQSRPGGMLSGGM